MAKSFTYEPMPIAGYNQALEQAATAADDEAMRLGGLASAIRLGAAREPSQELEWREEEYKAAARAAHRIAATIRSFKIEEEEG